MRKKSITKAVVLAVLVLMVALAVTAWSEETFYSVPTHPAYDETDYWDQIFESGLSWPEKQAVARRIISQYVPPSIRYFGDKKLTEDARRFLPVVLKMLRDPWWTVWQAPEEWLRTAPNPVSWYGRRLLDPWSCEAAARAAAISQEVFVPLRWKEVGEVTLTDGSKVKGCLVYGYTYGVTHGVRLEVETVVITPTQYGVSIGGVVLAEYMQKLNGGRDALSLPDDYLSTWVTYRWPDVEKLMKEIEKRKQKKR